MSESCGDIYDMLFSSLAANPTPTEMDDSVPAHWFRAMQGDCSEIVIGALSERKPGAVTMTAKTCIR